MMEHSFLKLTAGRRRKKLSDGSDLRILSALEVLEARREAEEMGGTEEEQALYSNACLLARAWEKRGKPCYASAEGILKNLSVSQVQNLAGLWAEFDREENPGFSVHQKRLDALKKVWSMRLRSAFVGVCSVRSKRSQQKNG